MGVRIQSLDSSRLMLSGDIEAVVDLPFRAVREGFTLAFSNGTLVRGDLDFGSQACTSQVEVEGAAEVKILRSDAGETIEVGWATEWISIAAGDDTVRAGDTPQRVSDGQLMLGIDQSQAARVACLLG